MKRLLLLLTFLSACAFSSVDRVLLSTVQLSYAFVDKDDQPHTSVCTGFVVDAPRGYALTAKHCIPKNGEKLLVDGEETSVLRVNDAFALVSVPKMTKPPLDIKKGIKVGDEVVVYGYGFGDMVVFHRHVARLAEGDVVLDGPLAPGMSGGPVVDGNGNVVGLNQASNEVMSIVCGAGELQEFLKEK